MEKDENRIKEFPGVLSYTYYETMGFGDGEFIDNRYGGKYFVVGRANGPLEIEVHKNELCDDWVKTIVISE